MPCKLGRKKMARFLKKERALRGSSPCWARRASFPRFQSIGLPQTADGGGMRGDAQLRADASPGLEQPRKP